MIKSLLKFSMLGLLAAAIAAAPGQAFGQDAKPKAEKPKTTKPEGAKKSDSVPFKGKIDAVDKVAQTITVGTRTFHVMSTTTIKKAGKPATFADAVVGEEVGGSYKDVDGKLQLKSLRVGPKPEATTPKAKKPAKSDAPAK